VQGGLVPALASWLRVPSRYVEPEPWALGVRLRDEPEGAHRLTVVADSPADGRRLEDLTGLPGDAWVSFCIRDGRLLPVGGDTLLQAGDELLVLADPDARDELTKVFEQAR
jgi:potassium/hydrogen antiporter